MERDRTLVVGGGLLGMATAFALERTSASSLRGVQSVPAGAPT